MLILSIRHVQKVSNISQVDAKVLLIASATMLASFIYYLITGVIRTEVYSVFHTIKMFKTVERHELQTNIGFFNMTNKSETSRDSSPY